MKTTDQYGCKSDCAGIEPDGEACKIHSPRSEHTPTPWNVQTAIKEFVPLEQGGGLKVRVFDAEGNRVASMNVSGKVKDAKANAAYI